MATSTSKPAGLATTSAASVERLGEDLDVGVQ
jgi:hypothetical protein